MPLRFMSIVRAKKNLKIRYRLKLEVFTLATRFWVQGTRQ